MSSIKFGYARVSTKGQSLDMQMDALLSAGVDQKYIFTDVASGVREDRPGLDKMLSMLRSGDEVVVYKLDRISRNTSHMLKLAELWNKTGVNFRTLTDANIDTTTASGKLMFTMMAALAQMERDQLIERTNAGLQSARKKGRKGGRRPGISPENMKKARIAANYYQQRELSVPEIMELTDIKSTTTFYKYIRAAGVEPDGVEPRK